MVEGEEQELEEEDHIGQEAKEVKFECMPCEKEVRIHNLNHIPFRSWVSILCTRKSSYGCTSKEKG